ncbi:MAG: Cytochrome c551 peroxidase (EC [uncultured Sulfurovum sp.]|uniref:Cytochrome c551 peroxidase (EC) n=1 Tax=uncultured Sulfurovum sp. TaxID=269237 RepID=A0A6S6THF4_9BACT|nr:MAG: Cytochrome c551 peroxidase (EC [uncultured Sulfurovum sp.]
MFNKTILLIPIILAVVGCGGDNAYESPADITNIVAIPATPVNTQLSKSDLGEKLFSDTILSQTQRTSCATCHDPDHAFMDARFKEADINQSIFIHGALSVGDDGSALGGRNTPTASYAMFSPTLTTTDGVLTGGQFHDGRAVDLADQATRPPLDENEMQMPSKFLIMDRIQNNSEYVTAFKNLYGDTIFDDVEKAYDAMGDAIGEFEKTDVFAPFDSKYDVYVQCKEDGGTTSTCLQSGDWSVDEQLGMDLFFSEANTNCASCHQLQTSTEISGETFTNYKYENIGTPKNLLAIKARFDLGLADSNPTDHGALTLGSPDGAMKVPTLRNVAVTAPYMHNGVFNDLTTVLEFYEHLRGAGNKAINPETNAPWGATDVEETINHELLQQGAELTDRKIEALEAFLKTLTDAKYESLIE